MTVDAEQQLSQSTRVGLLRLPIHNSRTRAPLELERRGATYLRQLLLPGMHLRADRVELREAAIEHGEAAIDHGEPALRAAFALRARAALMPDEQRARAGINPA